MKKFRNVLIGVLACVSIMTACTGCSSSDSDATGSYTMTVYEYNEDGVRVKVSEEIIRDGKVVEATYYAQG